MKASGGCNPPAPQSGPTFYKHLRYLGRKGDFLVNIHATYSAARSLEAPTKRLSLERPHSYEGLHVINLHPIQCLVYKNVLQVFEVTRKPHGNLEALRDTQRSGNGL